MEELNYSYLRAPLPVKEYATKEGPHDIKYVVLRKGDVYKNKFADNTYRDLFKMCYRFSTDGKDYEKVGLALDVQVSEESFEIKGFKTFHDDERVIKEHKLNKPWVLFSRVLGDTLCILPEEVFKRTYADELESSRFRFDIQAYGKKSARLIFDDVKLIDLLDTALGKIKIDTLRQQKRNILAFLRREFNRMAIEDRTDLAGEHTYAGMATLRLLDDKGTKVDRVNSIVTTDLWAVEDHIYYAKVFLKDDPRGCTYYILDQAIWVEQLSKQDFVVENDKRPNMDKFLEFYYFMLNL